jgi:hypothetical protein
MSNILWHDAWKPEGFIARQQGECIPQNNDGYCKARSSTVSFMEWSPKPKLPSSQFSYILNKTVSHITVAVTWYLCLSFVTILLTYSITNHLNMKSVQNVSRSLWRRCVIMLVYILDILNRLASMGPYVHHTLFRDFIGNHPVLRGLP